MQEVYLLTAQKQMSGGTQSITFQNVEIKIMEWATAETTLDSILKFPQLIF